MNYKTHQNNSQKTMIKQNTENKNKTVYTGAVIEKKTTRADMKKSIERESKVD